MASGNSIAEQISSIIQNRDSLKTIIASKGVEVPSAALLEDLPLIANTIKYIPSAQECLITFVINATGTDFQIPTDQGEMANLLNGAYIEVKADNYSEPFKVDVTSIEENTMLCMTVSIPNGTQGLVRGYLGDNSTPYIFNTQYISIQPGSSITVGLTTAKQMGEQVFYDRIQIYGDSSGNSYLRKRVVSDGKMYTYFGGFGEDNGWIDKSQMSMTVYSCTSKVEVSGDVSSTVLDQATPTKIYDGGGGGATDFGEILRDEFNLHKVTLRMMADTPLDNDFMQINPVYVKNSIEAVDFDTFGSDGNIISTSPQKCCVISITSKPYTGYHLHKAFTRAVRTDDGITVTEGDKAFFAVYPIRSTQIKYTDETSSTVTVNVGTSRPDGSREVGMQRNDFNILCKRLNDIPCKIIDGEDEIYIPLNDPRVFSASTYAEVGLQQLLQYMIFGINPPQYIAGITTSSVAATSNGATKFMTDAGILFGSINDVTDNKNSCVILGVEDGLHSSTGTMVMDVTFVIENQYDSELSANNYSGYFIYAEDRNDYQPGSNDISNLLANGYRKLEFPVNNATNRRIGMDRQYGSQDLFLPTSDQNQENITYAALDSFWRGGNPAAGANGMNFFLVALGGYRGHGSSLGLFACAADSGLAHADGAAWRSRLSISL